GVAGVFGRMNQRAPRDVVERWRGRHLFKSTKPCHPDARHYASLSTGAALMLKSAVLQVGNFDKMLRHSEDGHLGGRLLDSGWDVICDPKLVVTSIATNTLQQVLERYWRWYAGKDEPAS